MAVAVVDRHGVPLMPTTERRARRLLKSGRAKIFRYRPVFTVQVDREGGATQPVEYKCDTGYKYIGISVCSEKQEYINAQYDVLPDETERHNNCRKYRRTRRNRLRYRAPRYDNRKGKISEDKFAPSIRNKRDCHIRLFKDCCEVLPVTHAVFEMGQFDTQVLKAVEEGKPLPEGRDYQQGERYGYDTLREAVFTRDAYTCICCGKSIDKGAILRIHHLGYRTGDRSNRMSNLATVCTKCHTAKNHQKNGLLWLLEPKLKSFRGATFMTMVRWDMLEKIKNICPDVCISITYGAATKRARRDLGLEKTHSNDAYSMGRFHPKHRAPFVHYKKRRRNNRILEKFYDAKYIDIRDGQKKSGSELSCGRTNRSESRHGEKNQRVFRGKKVSKGRRSIRRQRYIYQPGDRVLFKGKRHVVKGTHCNGTRVLLDNKQSIAIGDLRILFHAGGWVPV